MQPLKMPHYCPFHSSMGLWQSKTKEHCDMNRYPNYQSACPLAFSTNFSSQVSPSAFPWGALKFVEPLGTPLLSSKDAATPLPYWHFPRGSTHRSDSREMNRE